MKSAVPFGFETASGNFWIDTPGFSRLIFSPFAEVDGKAVTKLRWKSSATRKNEWTARNGQGVWKLRLKNAPANFQVEAVLECRLPKLPQEVRLMPIRFEKFSADHVVLHGRKMGSCHSHVLGRGTKVELPSNFLIAVTKGATTLQLSHPLVQGDISTFSGQAVGKQVEDLSAVTLFAPCKSKTLRSAPVTINASRQGHDLMINWAEAQVGDRPLQPAPQESGWNSWDYYRWTITEDEVYKNAELIASDAVLSKHIKRIIVDDGWQYCYGEWEANHMFPSGMQKLARNLNKMGFESGLWFAPTIAELHSFMAQLHPEILTVGAAGIPCCAFNCMERKGFLLDPTHPKVQAYWDELFRRYAGYGYRYFKLDFLAWTVKARTFTDPKAEPGQLMRYIIDPIRKAVGSKSRILGCNFSFDGGLGLADDVRISSDIHANWGAIKENVSAIAARFWAHQRFWNNDPDFALCRGEETSNDPNLHQLKPALPWVRPENPNPRHEAGFEYMSSLVDMTKKEAEILLSLVITAGGAMNLSDNLPRLNAAGLRLLRKAVQAEKGNAAVPLDLFRAQYPEYWVQKLSSGTHRVLLINWSERSKTLQLDLAKLNVPFGKIRNFWTNEAVVVKGGKLSVTLAPHSCLLTESKS